MLLAQCAAFIGTQISNVDAVIAELMATLRHPPVVIDVLNDLKQPAESDELVWYLGMHPARARPQPLERLVDARGGRASAAALELSRVQMAAWAHGAKQRGRAVHCL